MAEAVVMKTASETESEVIFECDVLDDHEKLLRNYLPNGYHYRVWLFEASEDNPENFKAIIWMKVSTQEEAEAWFKSLMGKSPVTWRVRKTYPNFQKVPEFRRRNAFRVDYGCHHNTRPAKKEQVRKSSKHTSCEARVYLVVKRQRDKSGRWNRSIDPHIRCGYLTKCTIYNIHNHSIRSAEAMRRRDVSEDTRARLLQLYEDGYKPIGALEALKRSLQEDYGSDYAEKSADRSLCPDIQYCYRLYYSIYKPDCHQRIRKSLLDAIKSKLELNDVNNNLHKMATTKEGHTVIAICSGSMRRTHEFWPTSKELCYLDTRVGLERQNWKVTFLLTPSPVGELPLGILLASSGTPETLTLGLQLLHKLLPQFSFFERGHSGPSTVITRDDADEMLALHEVYPMAELLINPHAVVRTAKDWLWDPGNRIGKVDRVELLRHLKAVVDARTPDELNFLYDLAKQDAENRAYKEYVDYLGELYERREMWSVALHRIPALFENQVLPSVKVPLDKMLKKAKGYSVLMLIDDLLHNLCSYYVRKLIDAGNNRLERVIFPWNPKESQGTETIVNKVNEVDYEILVKSDGQTTTFNVNTEQGLCGCHADIARIPCRHQMAVYKKFGKNCGTFFPAELRSLFTKIATGKESQDDIWYQPLSVSKEIQITADGKEVILADDIQVEEALIELSSAIEEQVALGMIEGNDDSDDEDVEETQRYEPHEAHQQLQKVFADLEKRLLDDPVAFEGPVLDFAKNYVEASERGQLLSALNSFGQDGSASWKIQRMDEDNAPDTSRLHAVAESAEVHLRKRAVHPS
ncbi:uncharacterized protein LOC129263695 isoform X1 [Lytechinus pictus]|uniref:uncharacterized protein LOC129263695 isoform X1 n=1 Tax=Lytechinus pictus TaxID=7653 RepID=UPI0030B9BBD9